jgi:hypothetical protein
MLIFTGIFMPSPGESFTSGTVTVDNASYWILSQVSPTQWMSGVRCLAHLANLRVQAQEDQLQEQTNVSQKLYLSHHFLTHFPQTPTESHPQTD